MPALTSPPDSPPAHVLALEEQRQLHALRAHRRAHRHKQTAPLSPAAEHFEAPAPTRGQRLADGVASTIGSWRFIMIQSTAIVIWMTGNVLAGVVTAAPKIVGDTASNVADWSNSSANPLQPVGAWLGDAIYNITHPFQ